MILLVKEAVQYIIYLTRYHLDLQGQNEKKVEIRIEKHLVFKMKVIIEKKFPDNNFLLPT